MKKRKLKLSLNKSVVARLQNDHLKKVMGGATNTQLTCMPTCVDDNSIVMCEISDPCYNTLEVNCQYISNVNCE